jgi:hypothetical protein
MWLVCTHSRRDRCCAKFGLPLQAALQHAAKGLVWHSSHVGGHRFAPNVVLLPHGIMLGRVAPDDVSGLVADVQAGRLPEPRFWRGRTCLSPPVQTAEILARQALSYRGRAVPHVVSMTERDGNWRITLSFEGGDHFCAHVSSAPVAPIPKSCHEEPCALVSHIARAAP